MVSQRERERLAINDANQLKTKLREAHKSEIRENLFVSLQLAFKPNAPLFLNKLETDHKQGAPYASRFDGASARGKRSQRGAKRPRSCQERLPTTTPKWHYLL